MYTTFKVLCLLHDLTNLAESRALPQLPRSGSSPSLHRKAYVEADWRGWGLILCYNLNNIYINKAGENERFKDFKLTLHW